MRKRTDAVSGTDAATGTATQLKRIAMAVAVCLATPLVLVSCGGGGGGGSSTEPSFNIEPLGTQSLSIAEVNDIVARAVQASISRGVQSTIAITDRVGNVLAVYRMTNSSPTTRITSGLSGADGRGLDGFTPVPSELAAIAKAITGAYLSSTGNAFSTRTASQIVQEFFQPGETGQPSGPLYGVQFSQLPCSDLNVWLSQNATIGPKRSPLGLSADPGGFPIYQEGRVVGGIGVIASTDAGTQGIYGLDRDILTNEVDLEEEIAFAALPQAFRAPEQIRANRITANGQTFQFSNTTPAVAGAAALAGNGNFVAVTGYKTAAGVIAGTSYGTSQSGYVATTAPAFNDLNTFTLITNPADNTSVRFPPSAGGNLTEAEVQNILVEGMKIANRARAQIRNPLGSPAEVTVSVVDLDGDILGLVRSSDAPIFGTDVSVQKARSALTFSSAEALTDFTAIDAGNHASFANAMDTFFTGQASSLNGSKAFSARAIGNVHRPYFPDGEVGTPTGPLSSPISQWSPFNIGFQLNIVTNKVLGTLMGTGRAANQFSPPASLTCVDDVNIPAGRQSRFANGMQIFPGGFPIYKGDTLVGAIGVSGDGVDQDDMVGYLGVINGAAAVGSAMRPFPSTLVTANELSSSGEFLKYVQCPQTPFNNSSEQNVCPTP
ncbi:MAG: heme-binding protein [Limnobacter sp.]|uniref:heme-binding protein n=1 Tax=Limnobacter sp. TaxID=2003368 RepID=UPI0040379AD0